MSGRLIVITGIDGAGKTSVTQAVLTKIPHSVTIDWHAFEYLMRIPTLPAQACAAQHLAWLSKEARCAAIVYIMLLQFDQLIRPALLRNKYVLVDSFWYKYVAREMARGDIPDFFSRAFATMPTPDLIFVIDTPPHVAAQRVCNPNPLEVSPQLGFQEFQTHVREHLLRITEYANPHILNGQHTITELASRILTTVNEQVAISQTRSAIVQFD